MKPSCRVYFIHHADGRCTGILMPRRAGLFDPEPPSAYGETSEEVLSRLDVELKAREATGESIARYFWDVEVRTRTVDVPIHAQRAVDRRVVIGRRELPLRLTYAYSRVGAGGFRVDLPRFGWWLVVEDLEVAPRVLAYAVSGALLGQQPRVAFDFRHEGRERVSAWTPRLVARPGPVDVSLTEEEPPAELTAVAEDWVALARKRRLAPVVGAEGRFDLTVSAASAPTPTSSLLVGPSGVGKTAWVRRLAWGLAKRKAGRYERRKRLWATSRDRLIAGMVYLGQWQERALEIVEALRGEGDLLYVGRLSDFIAPQPDGTSLAEMFESAFLSGELSLIAEATPAELRVAQRRAPRFVEGFDERWVYAPSERQLVELVDAFQARQDRETTLAPGATRRLLRHLERYRPEQAFPGKAFQFLEWYRTAGSGADRRGPRVVDAGTLDRAFARWSGLPTAMVAEDEAAPARVIAETLGRRVIGQPAAVESVAEVVARFKAGLSDPNRPLGTLLFAGPTGVGKTQLAKELARWLFGDPARLVRADMSEYMLPGAARRLFAVEQGVTSIASKVREAPLSVVLLDEIEKAHPEVFDALLSVLGEGRLVDTGGREVSFRMTVIILTSNLGAGGKPLGGFTGAGTPDFAGAVRRHFRPELVNRLDRVVAFSALDAGALERIVDLELEAVAERTGLVRRDLTLTVSPEARRALASWGHDPEMGARPLKRIIEERVVTPIAALLARRPTLGATSLRCELDGDDLRVSAGS